MTPQWTTRPIDAPAIDMMDAHAVAKHFGFGTDTLQRLIDSGKFPAGLAISRRTILWDWQAVAWYRLTLTMQSRFKKSGSKPAAEEEDDE